MLCEDDQIVQKNLRMYLERMLDFVVHTVDSVAGLKEKSAQLPNVDLFLCDVEVTDGNSLTATNQIKKDHPNAAVIVLTGQQDEKYEENAFDFGANDFVTKPVNLKVLAKRIIIRMSDKSEDTNTVLFDAASRKLKRAKDQLEVSMSEKEAIVLKYLMDNQSSPVSRDSILEHIGDRFSTNNERTVDHSITLIRKRLYQFGLDKNTILSVRNQGYKYEAGSDKIVLT